MRIAGLRSRCHAPANWPAQLEAMLDPAEVVAHQERAAYWHERYTQDRALRKVLDRRLAGAATGVASD